MDKTEPFLMTPNHGSGKTALGGGVIESAPASRNGAFFATSKLTEPQLNFPVDEMGIVFLFQKTT